MQGTKEHSHCLQKVSGEVHSNTLMHMDCAFGQANSIFWKCNYYFFFILSFMFPVLAGSG